MSEVASGVANVPARGALSRPGGAAVVRLAAPWLVLSVAFAVLPAIVTSGSALTMLSLMGIMIVFALSYNMLLGETGLLSFGHAVYYGLGGFLAVHAMNTVIHDALPVPLPLIPLVGGFSGLLFGIIFGSVSTRRAGTAFAMISLGLGELVASSSLILRGFFGGEEGVSTNRTKLLHVFGLNFGPQIQVYYLIAGWCLLSHDCDVCAYPHAVWPHVQCGAREPRAGAICRLQSANGALHRLFAGRAVRRHRRRLGGHQFRAGQFLRGRRGAIGSGAARRLYRRHRQLHRSGDRRHPRHLAGGDAQRRHRRVATLFWSVVYRHGDVRAERHRRPHYDARAAVAGPRLRRHAAVSTGLSDRAGAGAGAARRPHPAHRDDVPSQRQGDRGNHDLPVPHHVRHCQYRCPGRSPRSSSPAGSGCSARPGRSWAPLGTMRSCKRAEPGERNDRASDRAHRPVQEFRRDPDHSRRQPGGTAGRAPRHHRAERRRQIDPVQPDQRPLHPELRHGPAQRR